MKYKKDRAYRIVRGVVIGMLVLSIVLFIKSLVDVAKHKHQDSTTTSCATYATYTDKDVSSELPFVDPFFTSGRLLEPVQPKFALTDEQLEEVAWIVAGQAVGKNTTCQTMVANVLYNQMLLTDGNVGATEYGRYQRRTPTSATREAVTAIFVRGEWMLDDTVLWTGDAEYPDAWHQTLQLVTTCDGVAFYEEG